VSDVGSGPGPTRAARGGERRRRQVRLGAAAVAAMLLVVAVLSWLGREEPASVVAQSPSVTPGASALMVLSVTGGGDAYVAVVGSGGGRPPAAMVLDPELTVVAPGQGDRTIRALAAGDGASMRVAVSNALGAWAARYGVMNLDALGAAVERAGGLTVNLPDVYTVGGTVLGPGEAPMDPRQVTALLREPSDDASFRWAAVLEGMLAQGLPLQATDFADSDDASGAAAIFGVARGATLELAPGEIVAGTVAVPEQPAFDEMTAALFGVSTPARAIVQNGSGRPGVGEAIAALILPEGFRIVISENADSFDHALTQITAHGPEHEADAEAVHDALGVGTVVVSQVASGFADVTIVVGRDFKG